MELLDEEALREWIEERIDAYQEAAENARANHQSSLKHVNQGRVDALREVIDAMDELMEEGAL